VDRIVLEKKEKEKKIDELENLDRSVDSEDNDIVNENNNKVPELSGKFYNKDIIEEYYQYLRDEFSRTNTQYEDSQFDDNKRYFVADGEDPNELKMDSMTFERIDDLIQDKINFFHYNTTQNLSYEFKIKRGTINDKSFIGK